MSYILSPLKCRSCTSAVNKFTQKLFHSRFQKMANSLSRPPLHLHTLSHILSNSHSHLPSHTCHLKCTPHWNMCSCHLSFTPHHLHTLQHINTHTHTHTHSLTHTHTLTSRTHPTPKHAQLSPLFYATPPSHTFKHQFTVTVTLTHSRICHSGRTPHRSMHSCRLSCAAYHPHTLLNIISQSHSHSHSHTHAFASQDAPHTEACTAVASLLYHTTLTHF